MQDSLSGCNDEWNKDTLTQNDRIESLYYSAPYTRSK